MLVLLTMCVAGLDRCWTVDSNKKLEVDLSNLGVERGQ